MSAGLAATLTIAGVAVASCIGSVLLLAVRVGRLIGITEERLKSASDDRARLWQATGKNEAGLQRHLEVFHGGRLDRY